MKKTWKYIGIIVSLVLPIAALIYFTGIYDFNIYHWLWCGFYGSIIVSFLPKEKIYKYLLIIANASILLFLTLGALMGGIYGIWVILLHMVLPFYSAIF